MKKIITCFLFLLVLTGCSYTIEKTISTTDNPFSDKQIEDAMAVIETEFKTHASKGDR
ncbi:membrane lipoprotein lipid attachment site-containing protein [Vagococcus sp. BWB3-3]|uniref:Membrane lipoprotein lipid attachment site-containing protein n=1 Tax=Vagococcus allomyrinae TaxID=2794353 RepID=A0A940PDH6_9ENTE|nr:lipoprotein [Vagococcus allomyrinae]MBP1042924.1 membrane lipoprotein lipid attachment site-containing protein [Vagococcus allomyrinae]